MLQTNCFLASLAKTFLTSIISKYEQESNQLEEIITSLHTYLIGVRTNKEIVDLKPKIARRVPLLIQHIPEEFLGESFYGDCNGIGIGFLCYQG